MRSIRFRFVAAALVLILGVAISQAQDAAAPGPRHFGGHHMIGFMTDYLSLTDAQQQQMKDIMGKQHEAMKPLMQQMHLSNLQLKQFETGAFDEAKVRTVAAQQAQLQTEMIVQRTRTHNEIFQILTPEQQAKMKDLMAKHQARMAQHMQRMHEAPAPAPEQ